MEAVYLTNLNGQRIPVDHTLGRGSLQVDVSGIAKGYYLIGIESSDAVTFRKVIVQ